MRLFINDKYFYQLILLFMGVIFNLSDTNTLKPATVESGATVRVPLFINEGETIEIDTRDGSYVSRVKA